MRSTEQNGLSKDMARAVRLAILCGEKNLLQSDAEQCHFDTLSTVFPSLLADEETSVRIKQIVHRPVDAGTGGIDRACMLTFMGGVAENLNMRDSDGGLAEMIRHKAFNGIDVPSLIVDVVRILSTSTTGDDWYGNLDALSYSPFTFYANPYRSPRRKKEQHPNADSEVWSLILNTTGMPPIADPCSFGRHGFGRVACQLDTVNGRAIARIKALTVVIPEHVSPHSVKTLLLATHKLMGLKYLHIHIDFAAEAKVGEFQLPGGPNTVSLSFAARYVSRGRLVVTKADAIRLKHLRHLALYGDVVHDHDHDGERGEVDHGISRDALAPLCKLRSLRSLDLSGNPITSLPACLGDLVELRLLDIRNARLQHRNALPPELSKLVNLKHFVVFGQGKHVYTGPASACSKRSDCMPSYETLLGDTADKDMMGPFDEWQCGSLAGNVDDLPVFGMARLERLWLDMNNLTMSPDFLERVVQEWPKLRTLDLYSNNINVNVNLVQKLKQLPQLHQLLLQDNNLHGTITASFFEGWPATWQTLNLALNRKITGCVHPHDIPQQLETFNYGGTKLVVSEACGRGRG